MLKIKKSTALIAVLLLMSALLPIMGALAGVNPILTPKFTGTNVGGASNVFFYDAKGTPDGGYVVVGRADGVSTNLPYGKNWGNAGEADAIMVKYDKNGTVEWSKNFGASRSELFSEVAVTSDGYVAVGEADTVSTNLPAGQNWGNAGEKDAIIVKVSTTGQVLWSKNLGSSSADGFVGVTGCEDKIIAVGYSRGVSSNLPAGKNWSNAGEADAIIVEFDSNGNVLWSKNLGGARYDLLSGVAICDGNIVAVGQSLGASTNLSGKDWGNEGASDAVIVELDIDGNVLWSKNLGGAAQEAFNDVTVVGDKIVAVGYSQGASTNLVTANWGNLGLQDAIIAECNKDGNILWTKNFGGALSDQLICADNANGEIIAVGYSLGASTNLGGNNWSALGNEDALAIKIDLFGNVLWTKSAGGTADEAFTGMSAINDGFVMVGWSEGVSRNIDTNWGNTSTSGSLKNGIVVRYKGIDTGNANVDIPAVGADRGIIASYTEDNRLLEVKIYDAANSNASQSVTTQIGTTNAAVIKTFSWLYNDSITPKTEAKTYKKTGVYWSEN